MNEEAKRRMEKLAAFLDKLPEENFNIDRVIKSRGSIRLNEDLYEKGIECGAICCAIGWTPKALPDCIKVVNANLGTVLVTSFEEESFETYLQAEWDWVAARLFDLRLSVAFSLFNRKAYESSDLFTPKRMAVRLRHFIETEEILSIDTIVALEAR